MNLLEYCLRKRVVNLKYEIPHDCNVLVTTDRHGEVFLKAPCPIIFKCYLYKDEITGVLTVKTTKETIVLRKKSKLRESWEETDRELFCNTLIDLMGKDFNQERGLDRNMYKFIISYIYVYSLDVRSLTTGKHLQPNYEKRFKLNIWHSQLFYN